MIDFLTKHNTRVNFLGSGKSPEEIFENIKVYAREFTSISKQERIQEALDQMVRYRNAYHLQAIDSVDIESSTEQTLKRYDDYVKMISYSIEEWYDLRNSITCDITGKNIPYDTNYFILNIDDGHDDCRDLVLSVDGLKQLCESASELLTN